MYLGAVQCAVGHLYFDEVTLRKRDDDFNNITRGPLISIAVPTRVQLLTIRLDSEFEDVLADPKDRSTVNAAAKCLNASVSGPPPATSNNCLSSNIEAYVLPDPLTPIVIDFYEHFFSLTFDFIARLGYKSVAIGTTNRKV